MNDSPLYTTQIVISLNDFGAEYVLPTGTSIEVALERCRQLEEEYRHKHSIKAGTEVRFHARNVRVLL